MKTKATLILTLLAVLTLVFISACNPFGSDDSDDNGDGIVDSNTGNGDSSDTGDDGSIDTDINNESNTGNDNSANAIETKYAQNGPYRVTTLYVEEKDVESNYGFTIFYPIEMTNGSHPIITWGNGTATPPSGYGPLLRHLASWGFVVVASNNTNVASGEDMIAGIDYLVEQNSTPGSPFFNNLDTGGICATGHSQGGGGAITAAYNDSRVTCLVPLAPAPALYMEKIVNPALELEAPMLIIAGSADTVIQPSWIQHNFSLGPQENTLLATRDNMGHIQFAWDGGNARGYLTAWLMYQLQNDTYAAMAFIDGCEICDNPDWVVNTDKWFVE